MARLISSKVVNRRGTRMIDVHFSLSPSELRIITAVTTQKERTDLLGAQWAEWVVDSDKRTARISIWFDRPSYGGLTNPDEIVAAAQRYLTSMLRLAGTE